jgi:hypothetical protein
MGSEPVCSYLAATDDFEALSTYIGSLREVFGHQDRWAIFNHLLTEATGSRSGTLIQLGILDAAQRNDLT